MKERLFDSAREGRVHLPPVSGEHGALNAIGNGDIMLYGRGPEWTQVLGAPYSCPTIFSLVAPEGERVACASHRRAGVGSWEHVFDCGTMTDCASRAHGCIARRWELSAPVRLDLEPHGFELVDQSAVFPEAAGAWLMTISAKTPVYNDYPLMTNTYMLVALRGGCAAAPTKNGLRLSFSGAGDMLVVSAKSYPEAVGLMQNALKTDFSEILAAADGDDRAFLARCAGNRRPLRRHPLTERALEAAEDVALLVRAQQHREGGVQAGHNYHMAYVRDQYGVSRGLIAMGAWDEARKILEFYRQIFERWGYIANAQAMGVDGIFHVHENDEVELTGYLLIQAADLMETTGDAEFFLSLRPMLNWALNAQLKWLNNDMLPFNGDETYVPGGMLPRSALNHGSFEATLLLIAGGRRYLDKCAALGVKEDWMDGVRRRIDRVSSAFEGNFRRGDIYVTNSLKRLEGLTEPEFRHGVCLTGDAFAWLKRADEGIYLCPKCYGKKSVPVCREEYSLKSTLLMEPFVRAGQIDAGYIAAQTAAFLKQYRETGSLPSRPDGEICLGYDFGLVLFAARASGLNADDLLADMLDIRDECGAWSEYYRGKTPRNTRCRPWESAINVAGALKYLEA